MDTSYYLDRTEMTEQEIRDNYITPVINQKWQGHIARKEFFFTEVNNYSKDGILLREVINIIDELDFEEYSERHVFSEIYENILKILQDAGTSGQFYTPRAVTDFMTQMINQQIGES